MDKIDLKKKGKLARKNTLFYILNRAKTKDDHGASLHEGGALEIEAAPTHDRFETKQDSLGILKEGKYFGEISLITNLKRSCTVRTCNSSTIAYIKKEHFDEIRYEFPQVYMNIKKGIRNYTDRDFEFRRSMIKSVPYFRHLED
jgi:hypothetical protein